MSTTKSSSQGAHILIVPGSFCIPPAYETFQSYLAKEHSLPSSVFSLRTVQPLDASARVEPPPSMYDDATAIAEEITRLTDEGKDVIVLAHSYGGVPTSESVKSLSGKSKEKLKGLIYVAAVVPDADGEGSLVREGDNWLPESIKVEVSSQSVVFTGLSSLV